MISIFNGRSRRLGEVGIDRIFLQVSVKLRKHLHLFKGAKLAVFLAIALHSDKDGWAEPSVKQIQRETGYNDNTIGTAIADLCQVTIEGHRVLLRDQSRESGRFASNRYLLFPSDEEVEKYESTVPQKTGHGEAPPPYPEKQGTEKQGTENEGTASMMGEPHDGRTTPSELGEDSSQLPDEPGVIVPEIVTDDDETLSPNDDFENGNPLAEHNPLLLAVVEVLALNLDTCSERKRLKAQECCERLRELMPGITDKARAIQVEGFGPWFASRSGFQDGIPYPSQLIDDWPRYRREIEQASKPQPFAPVRAAPTKSALNALRNDLTDELLKLGGRI